jgi:DNA primase
LKENYVDFRLIKQRVAIEAVLGHYGTRLRRTNKNSLRGKCPLPTHSSEKSVESFGVQTDKNIWACQSISCAAARQGKKGGNVIDFTAIMENCSVRDAALKLHDWFLSSPNPATTGKKQHESEKLVAEKTNAIVGDEVNKPLPFTLKDIDYTHPYVQQRGVAEDIAKHFGVGFFPGRGSMNGRFVIPISNDRGELVAYAGRAIDATEPKYKLPSGFKKSEVLFNLHRALTLPRESQDCVIVVEGFFDCIKVHQAGIQNVVALMGSTLSEAQEKLLFQFKRVVLFLDGDDAGRAGSQSIAARLISKTFVRIVNLPDGKQPDQLSSDEIKKVLSF